MCYKEFEVHISKNHLTRSEVGGGGGGGGGVKLSH